MVEGLRDRKIVHVAVGALHCLAVTDDGQVSHSLLSGINLNLNKNILKLNKHLKFKMS